MTPTTASAPQPQPLQMPWQRVKLWSKLIFENSVRKRGLSGPRLPLFYVWLYKVISGEGEASNFVLWNIGTHRLHT
jgi:hypothetical protein